MRQRSYLAKRADPAPMARGCPCSRSLGWAPPVPQQAEPRHPERQACLAASPRPTPTPLNSSSSSPHLQPLLNQPHLQPSSINANCSPLPLLPAFPTPTPSPPPAQARASGPWSNTSHLAEVREKVRNQAQSTLQGGRVPLRRAPLLRSPPTTRGQGNITDGC